MADPVANILSLCSGTAMLDEGLCTAMPRSRVVAYVEREAFAAALLLARMADAALDPAPVWCGNLEDFDAEPWHQTVDESRADQLRAIGNGVVALQAAAAFEILARRIECPL